MTTIDTKRTFALKNAFQKRYASKVGVLFLGKNFDESW